MKFRMDKTLRFWVDVAYEDINRTTLTSPNGSSWLKSCENTSNAEMPCGISNKEGKIAWKASPRFLMMLADAERDARDDLADFP